MNNKRKWLIAGFVVILLVGCHKNQKLDKPDNLINRNAMIEMMADGYILEAMVYIAPSEVHIERYAGALYAQMFKKYGVTKEDFTASLTYYLSEKDMATDFLTDAAEIMTKRYNDYYTEMHDIFEADSLERLTNEVEE